MVRVVESSYFIYLFAFTFNNNNSSDYGLVADGCGLSGADFDKHVPTEGTLPAFVHGLLGSFRAFDGFIFGCNHGG